MLREQVRLTGAGRTDAGVHALNFFAHFDTNSEELDKDTKIISNLNGILPDEIVVYRIIAVHPLAHARFNAISRQYLYVITTKKNPFTINSAYHFYRNLNIDKMNHAAYILPEYHDFTSFSKLHADTKTNLCNIMEARWIDDGADHLCFLITANRFLRNMVRAIVGTMLDIGLEKYPPENIRQIITAMNRNAAGTSAPAQGLYLAKIKYPANFFSQLHEEPK